MCACVFLVGRLALLSKSILVCVFVFVGCAGGEKLGIGGGGGGGKKLPNLTDLRRKEFEAGEEVKETIPPKSFEKDLIEDKDAPIDENLVLMERSEFSKMSYLAHKELERHKDDLKVRDVLKREGRAETVKRATPGVRLLAAVSLVVFVYAVFSVVSYSICRLNSGNLLSSLPPDFHFQPSTPLHKQGTLSRIIRGDQGIEESPLVVYFLRPKIKRLEMNYPGGAIEERFSLAVSDPTLLAIPRAYRGDSVVVRKHYRQFWPTNLGALTGTPLLSLTENGNLVLSAYEMLRITDSQNRTVGTAYVASERLNIRIDSLDDLPAQQAALLNARLVLLFSLLSI